MRIRTAHNGIRNEKGFTIVEVLISLTIFSIAVTGVITAAAQGGLTVNVAKNKLTATFLADEGIELTRALRDTHVVSLPVGSEGEGWTAFLSDITRCTDTAPCDIDATNVAGSSSFPSTPNVISCITSGCPLYYDPATGYYVDAWTSGGVTPHVVFSRKISVNPSTLLPDELAVTVTVTWKDGVVSQSLTQTETLFNWY